MAASVAVIRFLLMQPDFLNNPPTAWPSPEDEFLLKAALFQGAAAQRALQEWEARVELDRVDFGAFRLLPLLHHNLKKNGIASRDAERLAGIARRAWAENQLILNRASRALAELARLEFPVLLLKGVPLIVEVYRDTGLRTLGDVDILVHPADAAAILEWLTKNGWRYKLGSLPADPLASTTSLNFISPEGLDLDLHWAIFFNRPEPQNDLPFWKAATPMNLNGVPALGPGWADLFFIACTQGFRWDPVLPLRWVADAYWMLTHPDREMDWGRLVWQARRLEQGLLMRTALSYLKTSFELPVPRAVINQLQRIRPGGYERLERIVFLRRPLPLFGLSLVKYLTERRLPVYGGGGLLAYLRSLWGVRSNLQLLREALSRGLTQLRRAKGGRPTST